MNDEGMAYVPRDERPTLEDLEGYTESRFPADMDYSAYRLEKAFWLHDWRREQELKRQDEGGRTPLLGHEPEDVEAQRRTGYDVDTFFLERKLDTMRSRPQH
jgi:hypothetical protein